MKSLKALFQTKKKKEPVKSNGGKMSSFKWGKSSLERRATLCNELIDLVDLMLLRSDFDLAITCGYRGKEEQEKAFKDKTSKAHFGESAHNVNPSMAVDIIPCSPVNWDTSDKRWQAMVDNAKACAKELGIKITCGADWAMRDWPHIEIK